MQLWLPRTLRRYSSIERLLIYSCSMCLISCCSWFMYTGSVHLYLYVGLRVCDIWRREQQEIRQFPLGTVWWLLVRSGTSSQQCWRPERRARTCAWRQTLLRTIPEPILSQTPQPQCTVPESYVTLMHMQLEMWNPQMVQRQWTVGNIC